MKEQTGGNSSNKNFYLLKAIRQRLNVPTFRVVPAFADAPERWRTSMGGFDPATPFAEALINYHNHAVTYMIFVVLTVLHSLKK
ncbi:hypothetical protein BEWA_027510 [Theileria equi strain WA]|uniref:Uncharacterized protein n=1 Tax=Theileria equi strain WA TaxID=1537102 RepID=L0AWF1_THEEQ|nr:hypothetical protein BEWA_027510 [Theileria equi strain WA]AFZ79902.1 hypothetical protein BEWA_027510 [Theileria equi strain WA]|eukprot:XP_004829568.1 hypothetical protein BEWA_027510 [Theileria equi strain WA]